MSKWKEQPQIAAPGRAVLPFWWHRLAVAAGCAALAGLSIMLSRREIGMATLWYANAFGACCLLVAGRQHWRATLVALACGLLFAEGLAGADLRSAVLCAVPDLGEMALGGWLLARSPDWRQIHASPRAGWRVWSRAVLLPALCGATLAVPLLAVAGVVSPSATQLWLTWFERSLIGATALLPLGLSLLADQNSQGERADVRPPVRPLVTGEAVVLMALSIGTAVLVLPHLPFPFVYLGLLMLVAAVRLRYLDIALQVWLVSLAIGATMTRSGLALPAVLGDWQTLLLHLPLLAALLQPLLLAAALESARARQRALERERERLRQLYEHTPAMLHSIDRAGRIVAVSQRWLDRLGYPADEVVGRHATEFLDGASRQRMQQQVWPLLLRTGEIRDIELRMVCRDGALVDVLLSATAERDALGRMERALAIVEDVTRKRLAEQLAAQFQRMSVMLASIGDAVIGTDEHGRIVSFNPAAVAMTGCSAEQALGQCYGAVVRRCDLDSGEPLADPVRACLLDGACASGQSSQLLHQDGRSRVIRETITPMREPDSGSLIGAVATFQDMTTAHELARTLVRQARHDALTGLPNRRLLQDRLQQALQQARHSGGGLALMFLDLDHFKQINDRQGHDVGDELLRQIARSVQGAVRASDTVCRLGGDEFVVLLPQIGAAEDAAAVARHVLAAVAQPYRIGAASLRVSCSIGIAVFPEDGDDEATLMRRADTAMYGVKREGRNGLRFHDALDTGLGAP
jgi:diguanylate cyclase (GGDEF)-like protein/PAS domain S-box-containing protein